MAVSQEVMGILIELEGKSAFLAGAQEETLAVDKYTASVMKMIEAEKASVASTTKNMTAMGLVKKGMTGIGIVAAGIVGFSVKAAISWSDMAKKIQQQTGYTGNSLDFLVTSIKKASQTAPYAINEIADAAVLLRTKFNESDAQVEKSASLMAAFAQRAESTSKTAGTSLLSIMQDFGVPLNSNVSVMDKLIGVAQATQKPMGGLLKIIENFGPKLQSMGFDLDSTVKLLGVFQAAGIPTTMMGRGLSTALTKGLKEHEKTGEPISEIVQRHLMEIANAESKQEALNISLRDFGANVGPSFARALYGNATAFREVNKAMEETGQTEGVLSAQRAEVEGQWQELKNTLKVVGGELGESLVPILKEVIIQSAAWVKELVALGGGAKNLAPYIFGLVAAFVAYRGALILASGAQKAWIIATGIARGIIIAYGASIAGLRVLLATGALAWGVFSSTVVGANIAMAASAAATAASFAAMLAPVAALVAAYVALNKVLPAGDRPENLLGGNQPGESGREGEVYMKAHPVSPAQIHAKEAWNKKFNEHFNELYRKRHHFAQGGTMTVSGLAHINDAGPGETVFLPGGSSVQPSNAASMMIPRAHAPNPTPIPAAEPHWHLEADLYLPNGDKLASLVTKSLSARRARN